MYLDFPMTAAGNYNNIGFLKPDNRTTTIEGGVISVYRPVNENPPPPGPVPTDYPDWWQNSYGINIISPAIYDDNDPIYSGFGSPVAPTAQQDATLQNDTPQYYYFSGEYEAEASQYQPAGTPERPPAPILIFDAGNDNAIRVDGDIDDDYEYFIPLVDVATGLLSPYKIKVSYDIESGVNNIITCSLEIYNGDTYVEGFSVDNTDFNFTYNYLSSSHTLDYFIGGGDTVKQEAEHGVSTPIIKGNLLVIDFIHAETQSSTSVFVQTTYDCYHQGIALDLGYLKDTYGVALESSWLTVVEVPDFWVDSYHQNLYHGSGTNVTPGLYHDVQDFAINYNGWYETNYGLIPTDDIGISVKRFTNELHSANSRPFEYNIPLYDSNDDLSDYYIKIRQQREQSSPFGVHICLFLDLYQQDTLIDNIGQGAYPSGDDSYYGVYFFAGADTFQTETFGSDRVEANDLLITGAYASRQYNNNNLNDSTIYIWGPTAAINLAWLETEYGVHLGSNQLTIN